MSLGEDMPQLRHLWGSHRGPEEPSLRGNAGDSGNQGTGEGPEGCSAARGLPCAFRLGGLTDRVSPRQVDASTTQTGRDRVRREEPLPQEGPLQTQGAPCGVAEGDGL